MSLPDSARDSYDRIYRATDMYLQVVLWSFLMFHVIWFGISIAYWILYWYFFWETSGEFYIFCYAIIKCQFHIWYCNMNFM
jgi:hypothetical protein